MQRQRGFDDHIAQILDALPDSTQLVFSSSRLSNEVKCVVDRYMNTDHINISVNL